jgi:AcrR family transcriptional regulator
MPEHATEVLKPRRGRPRGKGRLNREAVIETALEIVEANPNGDLSLRELARRLRVTPMALYNHFSSMNEIEEIVLSKIFSRDFNPIKYHADTSGKELVIWCQMSLYSLVKRYPKIFDIAIDNAAAQEMLRYQEAFYEGLTRCGVPAAMHRTWARILASFIRGTLAWDRHRDREAWARMEDTFRGVDVDQYPHFASAVASMESISALGFRAGLSCLVDAMIASSGSVNRDALAGKVQRCEYFR